MAGKKKKAVNINTSVNNGLARLKIKSSKSPPREDSTPSSASDDASQRLTATLPRYIEPDYAVNTQVICQYSDSYYYDAKIVKVQKNEQGESMYTIHYNGWNQRYDEEITHAEACQKFLVYTPENLVIAKSEITEARKRKHSKSSNHKKTEKKTKKEDSDEKPQPVSKSERTRTQSSNTRQGSSTSRVEGGVEASNNEAESEEEFSPVPYLAQVPKEKRTTLIFPQNIDQVLLDDCDLVTRQLKLPKTGGKFNVDHILNDYITASYGPDSPDNTTMMYNIDKLFEFFNKMVNMRILYKFEFVQHLELLNKRRRRFNLPDLLLKDFLDQEDFNGPESPASEEAKEDEDIAFKPPKQVNKPEASTEGESEKRQLRETRNKKAAVEQPAANTVVKPKKKEKPVKPSQTSFEAENNYDFADEYGFIHLVRFFYYYNSLLKHKTIANAIYTKYAELCNDIIEFLSLNVNKYFNVEEDYEIATPAYQRQAFSH